MTRLGVLGGTFDPIHVGHVTLAREAIACAHLDRLLLLPASIPPHKHAASASADDRLEMCRLACAELPHVEVSDLELRRDGPSFTVDTLQALHDEEAGAELSLVLGWDAARLLPAWREPRRVLELAGLVLFRRPGVPGPTDDDLRAAGIDAARTVLCDVATPEVDATEIRRRAATGASLDGLVPPAVAAYIAAHGLYGSAH
jgi:nicotinate-nucleotide adenylyltransferase